MHKENKKIVIAIENQEFVNALKPYLEDQGFEIIAATNGLKALKIIREHKPSVVLLHDLLSTVDGYKVCKLLKSDQRYKTIPVIFLMSHKRKSDIDTAQSAGSDRHHVYPWEIKNIVNDIHQCSHSHDVLNESTLNIFNSFYKE